MACGSFAAVLARLPAAAPALEPSKWVGSQRRLPLMPMMLCSFWTDWFAVGPLAVAAVAGGVRLRS
jgi:hypothetical protein